MGKPGVMQGVIPGDCKLVLADDTNTLQGNVW